jgi:hypothetical protein
MLIAYSMLKKDTKPSSRDAFRNLQLYQYTNTTNDVFLGNQMTKYPTYQMSLPLSSVMTDHLIPPTAHPVNCIGKNTGLQEHGLWK